MRVIEYYSSLRQDLLSLVADVNNAASWDIWFMASNSNSITKIKLEKIYRQYLDLAVPLGLITVTRHISCPNPDHIAYIASNDYGLEIFDQDPDYEWHIHQVKYKKECKCPCSDRNLASQHEVLEEMIFLKKNTIPCQSILSILKDIEDAVSKSRDNRPRSGIREKLLMAIIKIDNQIVPGGMDSYINKLKRESSESS